jgi:hypothetical protein
MEDKQQQQQQDVALQPRRSSQLVGSSLTKETRINTNKKNLLSTEDYSLHKEIIPLLLLH